VTLDTATDHAWLDLEDGVQVQFQGDGPYRSGDYWLIPARTEIGDVLWPGTPGNRTAKQPDGVPYYFAPLGLVTGAKTVTPLRHLFSPLP
jgi:hypothetical protein